MDARKKLYKAGPRDNPTLSERVKNDKNRRRTARHDTFASVRQIQLEDSAETPSKLVKLSKIDDRNEKLKAYRIQKNTQKFKEVQEQRSPFIVAVPSGRWVEKKEKALNTRVAFNDTPIKNALMNERVPMKKSTIKTLIGKSAKKENLMTVTAEPLKKIGTKSKKRILAELNSIPVSSEIESNEDCLPSMDTTFEISPELNEEDAAVMERRVRRSNSLPEIVTKASKENIQKILTPQAKKVTLKKPIKTIKKQNFVTKAVKKPPAARIVKPVIVPAKKPDIAPVRKPVVVQKAGPTKKIAEPTTVATHLLEAPPVETNELSKEPSREILRKIFTAKSVSRKVDLNRSETYKLYFSMKNNYSNFLTNQLEKIEKDGESFIEILEEEQQIFVRQTVQQGKLLTTDKLKRFEEFLLKHEDDLSRPDDPKRVTADDVENYWDLVYDEIEKLKGDLMKIQEMQERALTMITSQKKRRTRRTFIPADGTPRRSRRIAENTDTPKHNASCYGCVTMSASKVNTPTGIKRRTTVGKSILFKDVIETPKRSESRRSTKRYQLTPARNFVRMDAVDAAEEDELAELL